MSEISDNALEILYNRKVKLKEIEGRNKEDEEQYKQLVKLYSKLIFDVFRASNSVEESNMLVWKIWLSYVYDEKSNQKLECVVSFSKTDAIHWQSNSIMERWICAKKVKSIIEALRTIEQYDESKYKVTKGISDFVNDIYNFLKEEISEKNNISHYNIERRGSNGFVLSMNIPVEE